MKEYYLAPKSQTEKYCILSTDEDEFLNYLFSNTIPESDLDKISPQQLIAFKFSSPVVLDKEKFEKSKKEEGFILRRFSLDDIRSYKGALI